MKERDFYIYDGLGFEELSQYENGKGNEIDNLPKLADKIVIGDTYTLGSMLSRAKIRPVNQTALHGNSSPLTNDERHSIRGEVRRGERRNSF